ncbi:MAG: ribonuclease H-like domain-containing protein, partial [Anaerolineales bacterium]
MPNNDLRSRLQRLRPQKSKPTRELIYEPLPETVLPGREYQTSQGAFQLIEERYPLTHRHGHLSFDALFVHQAEIVAKLARAPQFATVDLRGLAFLDTETTGLAGGAGTLAFLSGVGVFVLDHFALRHYFLRRPEVEPARLAQLVLDRQPRAGWVPFKGRAFDLP